MKMSKNYLFFLLSLLLVVAVNGASVSKKIKEKNAALKVEAREAEEEEDKTEVVPEIETVVPDEKPVKVEEIPNLVVPAETTTVNVASESESESEPEDSKPVENAYETTTTVAEAEVKPVDPEPSQPEETFQPEEPVNPETPKRKTITYDQRQEGELNIRADLENFMIIFMPTKKASDVTLLDLFLRSAAKNAHKKKKQEKVQEDEFKAEQSPKFEYSQFKESSPYYSKAPPAFINSNSQYGIESRSPYKVDISSTLVHPEPPLDVQPQFPFHPQFGRTPFHPAPGNFRTYRSLSDNYFDTTRDELDLPEDLYNNKETHDALNRLNIESIDKIDRFDEDPELTLIGASENCGPDRKRDSYGVCQFVN